MLLQPKKLKDPEEVEAPLVALPAKLDSMPLVEVALFLHFLYSPETFITGSLQPADRHMAGVARLADYFQAESVLHGCAALCAARFHSTECHVC
jgi:hypothetical protein